MKSNFIKVISGIILSSLILIGCSNSKDNKSDDMGTGIETQGIEYIKSIDKVDESGEKHYQLIYGKVTEDKDNLSIVESIFSDQINMDNGYQSGVCFIDTKDTKDLKVGDFAVINIEIGSNGEWNGYVFVKGPMNEDEIKKYEEEERKRKEEELQNELEVNKHKKEEEENKNDKNNISVGKRMNDNRDRGSKDDGLWITLNDQSMWFVPELNQAFFEANYENMLRQLTVDSKSKLGTIRGTFDAEVVLSGENKVVIAIKPSDKYEYYCLKVNKKYSIGDKFKVSMDNDGRFFIEQ
ncbi:hypothetical protein [Clostridium tertium]|uniref:hypothetical protein n=1 Tax=Clostridium tertium TaxID=1559 RepID=UPI000BE297AB|nr:hypothetical protein [Clostridium tertium]